ncbi:hypothetical protein FHS39_000012 [Streptomyces olivoverticillatus]|uniref:DNA primase/polymerase bifunctional N-terminal domain-containing protein n=1 Tax=Streptomyces olivoverticillatus TaxID=66427 RepID=A0A7W7LIW3_9ACTN|nr:hypothetical protein [Streptomyces olivoverticillatus]MBB4891012.1 hypothetical protein [Streptomyces olivoverticillatus]
MSAGADARARRALEWLASAAPDPRTCRREWDRNPLGVALLPAGRLWDVLILASGPGYATLDVLTRRVEPGPVIADFGDARLGFFVPPGTAAHWVATGVRGVGAGTWVVVPHPERARCGVRWVVPPDGSGRLTDPAELEAAMHEAAAGPAHGRDG